MPTEAEIRQMMPNAGARLDAHLPYINPALDWGQITTPRRIAAFMAQLAHESGEYRFMEEIADGSAYEGREDLGNTHPGDGPKYKGHGPIQITGRAAHKACGEALGLDLINNPTLICKPEYGTKAAVWFWTKYKPPLNAVADKDWFRTTTRIVNGGFNGWADRLQYYTRDRALLGLPPYTQQGEDASIRAFQGANGLGVDGDAGQNTLKKLMQNPGA
jgi:predicted chitinase